LIGRSFLAGFPVILVPGGGFIYGKPRRRELLMAETAIQFLERWRQAHVYAEQRTLDQLDETVAECIGAAGEDDIAADDLEKAAGGSLKEYLRIAIINTSE
jgi:hypothetical protein